MNRSDWKGTEKLVATALGGKRRHRTMGSFATVADDVYFPKKKRRLHPRVKEVAVEVKKRRTLNIHAIFSEASLKYCSTGKHLILASKIPRVNFGKNVKRIKRRAEKRVLNKLREMRKKYQIKHKKPMSEKSILKAAKRLTRKGNAAIKKSVTQLRHRHNITALVTVDLPFFKELWEAWLNETLSKNKDV